MVEELFRLTQAETGILSQDAYPDMSPTYPAFIELYRYQVPVGRRLIFRPGHTFSLYAMLLSDQALDGAVALDAETATIETVEANESSTDDMTLTPGTPASNDEYHFGYRFPFKGLTVKYTTASTDTGGSGTWEYTTVAGATPNAATWVALPGITDATDGWVTAAGTHDITWTMPRNWVQSTAGGSRLFWVRCRITVSAANQATGDQAWINPDPTAVDNFDQFKIEVRDQNELARKPIIQPSQYRTLSEFTDRDLVKRLDIAEAVVANAGDWVVVSTNARGVVDVSGCYFELTCDKEAIRLF